MSGKSKQTKAEALAQVQALIAGTQKHFPNGSITLGKATYTTDALVKLLESLATAIASLNAAQSSAKDALSALRGIEAQVDPVIGLYKSFLRVTFGSSTSDLADFAMQPPKARKALSAEEKTAAAAKGKATRAKRGTTSKKQKLAVKGDVTGVVVTPVTTPAEPVQGIAAGAAPSPSAQPAPTASSTPPAGGSKP
jgi:ABC-type transporter Mla subunit MlaD